MTTTTDPPARNPLVVLAGGYDWRAYLDPLAEAGLNWITERLPLLAVEIARSQAAGFFWMSLDDPAHLPTAFTLGLHSRTARLVLCGWSDRPHTDLDVPGLAGKGWSEVYCRRPPPDLVVAAHVALLHHYSPAPGHPAAWRVAWIDPKAADGQGATGVVQVSAHSRAEALERVERSLPLSGWVTDCERSGPPGGL